MSTIPSKCRTDPRATSIMHQSEAHSLYSASEPTQSPLSCPFLGNIVEICIVTPDAEKTMTHLASLGIGPFKMHRFHPGNCSSQTYRGVPTPFELKVCFAQQGSMTWELMEPICGPSIMADYLGRNPEGGVQHVAFDCGDVCVEGRIDGFKLRGYEVIQSGIWHGTRGTCEFYFFDTQGAVGTCFETYKFSEDWEDPVDTLVWPVD